MTSQTNIKIISLICTPENKNATGSYKIALGSLSNFQFEAVSLKGCTFRNVQYNVRATGANINNTFYFDLDGTPETVIIPEGFYTIYELIAVVKLGIETILASSGIIPLPTLTSLEYNSISAKVEILVDGNGSATAFDLTGGTNEDSINFLMGNSIDVSLETLTPTLYTFDSLVNLQGQDVVHLICSNISQNAGIVGNLKNGKNLSLVRVLPVSSPFGGLCIYDSSDIDGEAIRYNNPVNLTNIEISITDVFGNTLDLGNTTLTVELICWITVK